MFNKYYMFNKELDSQLKELGFEFDINNLCYKSLCEYDLRFTKAIEFNICDDLVSAQRVPSIGSINTHRYVKRLSINPTIDEIKVKLEKLVNDITEDLNCK